jgi:hypothetical protein
MSSASSLSSSFYVLVDRAAANGSDRNLSTGELILFPENHWRMVGRKTHQT